MSLLALNPELQSKLTTDRHPALKYFIPILQNRPNANSISIGYENEDFYGLINLNNYPELRKRNKLTDTSIWAVVSLINGSKSMVFLDKELKNQLSISEPTSLKVTSRIWYKQAVESKSTITTDRKSVV